MALNGNCKHIRDNLNIRILIFKVFELISSLREIAVRLEDYYRLVLPQTVL